MIRNTSLRSTVIHHFEAGPISVNNWMRYMRYKTIKHYSENNTDLLRF